MTTVGAAEQSRLITEIGAWVLERSCRDHLGWQQEHPDAAMDMAVNVSPHQLMSPGFCELVAGVLHSLSMDPSALVLEMTENILIEDIGRATTVLADLKRIGTRIALDDFGTGYCSLNYLKRLPIDIVKIDQGFVADIGQTPDAGAFVAAVTNLAHVLGITVIAEGVETPQQSNEITAIGCESAQGYFYAPPMPAAAISTQLNLPRTAGLHLPVSHETQATAR
jgi:EAL domain-containing protein (putative c-di-GMP-specific phosphodiesterase class I)